MASIVTSPSGQRLGPVAGQVERDRVRRPRRAAAARSPSSSRARRGARACSRAMPLERPVDERVRGAEVVALDAECALLGVQVVAHVRAHALGVRPRAPRGTRAQPRPRRRRRRAPPRARSTPRARHPPRARARARRREERRLRVHGRAHARASDGARPGSACAASSTTRRRRPRTTSPTSVCASRTTSRPIFAAACPAASSAPARAATGAAIACQGTRGSSRPSSAAKQPQHLGPTLAERRERAGSAAELRRAATSAPSRSRASSTRRASRRPRARTSSAPPAGGACAPAIGVARCVSASARAAGGEPGELSVEDRRSVARDEHRRGVEDVLARRSAVSGLSCPRSERADERADRDCRRRAPRRRARRCRRATPRTRSRQRPRRRRARTRARRRASLEPRLVRDRVAEAPPARRARRRSSMREEDGGVLALHADIEPQSVPLALGDERLVPAGHAVAARGRRA